MLPSGDAISSAFGGDVSGRADDSTRKLSDDLDILVGHSPKITLSVNMKTGGLAVGASLTRRYSSTAPLHGNRDQTCSHF
jgi:hypothetical protein